MKRKLSIFVFLLALSITSVTAQSSQTNRAIAKVADTGCTGQDTFDQGVKIVPNANSWKDSYQANNYCFCNSSFDHGVGNFKININGKQRNIRDICNELKKHPNFRNMRNGDPRYNTIQCGNEPGHGDAITIRGKRIKDEKVCPGRVDQGSKGCKCIGPKFDMAWLKTRPRFDGGGNPTPPPPPTGAESINLPAIANQTASKKFTFPVQYTANQARDIVIEIRNPSNKWLGQGKTKVQKGSGTAQIVINLSQVAPNGNRYRAASQLRPVGASWQQNIEKSIKFFNIAGTTDGGGTDGDGGGTDGDGGGTDGDGATFKGESINKYVSSEGGSRSMRANRTTVSAGEKFVVTPQGNGTVSIKGNNGKYVSHENGGKAMTCNRSAVGSWEKFTLESLGGDLYAIKGSNGKYVSHENGKDKGMFCNRNGVGLWEKFIIKGLVSATGGSVKTNSPLAAQQISIYPNPATKENISLQINSASDVNSMIEIMNLNGQIIASKNLGLIKAGTTSIALDELSNKVNTAGLYMIRVTTGQKTYVKQILIK